MSGIAGIFHFNNRPCQQNILATVVHVLQHRGPDGSNTWHADSIGLAHCMHQTTPESRNEYLPWHDATPDLTITADARIDNRAELAESLQLKQAKAKELPDSLYILEAYKKWGRGCASHLLGDFAFTIWDGSQRKLYCARDHMGVRPFFYHHNHENYIFASEIKGILASGLIAKEANEERIADYLVCTITDNESTFFKGIHRLPPGHWLEVTSTGIRKERYWQLTCDDIVQRPEDQLVDEFGELFFSSVSCRMRSAFPLGSHLSGGLDSSSIVATLASIENKKNSTRPIHTFSGIFPTIQQCDESDFIQSVTEKYTNILTPHSFAADAIPPGALFEKLAKQEDEPFYIPHFFMGATILNLASQNNVRVLFDGHDGDSAVSYGLGLFPELLSQGRLFQFYRESLAIAGRKKGVLSHALQLTSAMIKDRVPDYRLKSFFNAETVLATEYLQSTSIQQRINHLLSKLPQDHQKEQEQHLKGVTMPYQAAALESLNRLGAAKGIQFVFPFADIRLLNFCLNLPASLKLRSGLNRFILRRALQDILPEKIYRRKFKKDFSLNSLHAYRQLDREWLERSLRDLPPSLFNRINHEFWQTEKQQYLDLTIARPPGKGIVLKSLSLGRWLARNNFT